MGQAWCKGKADELKTENSKLSINRIFRQCAHRIYPNLKEDGSIIGCATQRVTSSEIGYAGPSLKKFPSKQSIDSVDRPFCQSDWVDVNLEVSHTSPIHSDIIEQQSLDSDLYHKIISKSNNNVDKIGSNNSKQSLDNNLYQKVISKSNNNVDKVGDRIQKQSLDNDDYQEIISKSNSMNNIYESIPRAPPRLKRKNKSRPLPPTPQDHSQQNLESLYASIIPKLKRNSLDVYEHKVNGTGEIISSGMVSNSESNVKSCSNQSLSEVNKSSDGENTSDCNSNLTRIVNDDMDKTLNEINKIKSDEMLDSPVKFEKSIVASVNKDKDVDNETSNSNNRENMKTQTFHCDITPLDDTELSNQCKESNEMLSLISNESEPFNNMEEKNVKVDSAVKLTESISEESIPSYLMTVTAAEDEDDEVEGIDEIDFFDNKIIKDTKNELEKIREELEKNEMKIRSSQIVPNVKSQMNEHSNNLIKVLKDELNESNMSSLTELEEELSDMLERECEKNCEDFISPTLTLSSLTSSSSSSPMKTISNNSKEESISEKIIEPEIVPSIIEESPCHHSPMVRIDLTNKKEERKEIDSDKVNIDNISLENRNEVNLFDKNEEINFDIPIPPKRQHKSLNSK